MIHLDNPVITAKGPPLSARSIPDDWRSVVPDYCALLTSANGLNLFDGLFRVFGIGETALSRDALDWNTSAWRASYLVPESIIFLAENVFGDQYGLDTRLGLLTLMSCEGGKFEELSFKSLTELIESIVNDKNIQDLEIGLVKAGRKKGLRPSLSSTWVLLCL